MMLTQSVIHRQFEFCFIPHTKMNSKLLRDIEATPIKFSEENIKIDLHDFDPGNGFLATSP